MVRLFFLLLLVSKLSFAVPLVKTAVTDHAGVLSTTEEMVLDRLLVQERTSTGLQMAVLIIRSTEGEPIQDYAIRVAERWGGGSKKRSDGVLLLLAIDDRTSRLEVGYDLEDKLTDSTSKTILDNMRPNLRRSDYAGAIKGAIREVSGTVSGMRPVVPYRPRAEEPEDSSEAAFALIALLFFGALVVVLMLSDTTPHRGSSRGWGRGSWGSSWGDSSSWGSSSDSSWGGFGSSGGSSGGFSGGSSWGGGGGGFGGGGASSGW